jgi:hypothetical protein
MTVSKSKCRSAVAGMVAVVGLTLVPAGAQAQTQPQNQTQTHAQTQTGGFLAQPGAPLPVIAAGAVFGRAILSELDGQSTAVAGGSLQLALSRRFVFDTTVSRWTGRDTTLRLSADEIERIVGRPVVGGSGLIGSDRREVTGVHLSAFFRAGTDRVLGFAGGGATIQRTADTLFGRLEPCEFGGGVGTCITPGPAPTVVRRVRVGPHIAGGADFRLGRGVFAVSAVRWQLAPEPGLDITGGVRIALRSRESNPEPAGDRPPAADQRPATTGGTLADYEGRDVRVISASGARRTGRLVGVASDAVTLRAGRQDVVFPLREISRIETEPHYARNLGLIGAIGGFFAGWLGSCGSGDEEDCWPEVGLLVAGIAGGAGAGIGAMMNSSSRRVIYTGTPLPIEWSVRPMVVPRGAGVAAGLRW